LNYLNSKNIHAKIQNKMLSCIYGKQSNSQDFRINYDLAIRNVAEYNVMLLEKTQEELLLVKSKQNQGGGSSGTPIEDNKKTLEQDFGRSR
jgi:hypothetical protein